jgi:hypothetical protein
MEASFRNDGWVFTGQVQGAMGFPLQEQGVGFAFSKDPLIN